MSKHIFDRSAPLENNGLIGIQEALRLRKQRACFAITFAMIEKEREWSKSTDLQMLLQTML